MATQLQERPYATDARPLVESLGRIVARIRFLRWVKAASAGAFCGVCVSLVGVVLGHIDLLPDWLMLEVAIPVVIILGVAVGSVFALMRPVLLMDAARVADTRLELKERLSSALEFERSGDLDFPLMRLQLRDAARYAGAVQPKDAVPFRAPWQFKALIASLVVLALALFLPTLPVFTSPIERLERSIVKLEGDKLAQQAKTIEHTADMQNLPHTKWVAQQMRRLAQQMQRGHMDKRKAFLGYGKLTQQMRDVQRQLSQSGAGQPGKSLASAGQQLSRALQGSVGQQSGQVPNAHANAGGQGRPGAGAAPGTGGAGKAGAKNAHTGFNIPDVGAGKPGMPSTASQNGANNPTAEVQQAARAMEQGSTQGLSEQLRQLANRVQSGQMSPSELNQAQQDVQKLSDALKGTPMKETQQHSQAAADALRQGDKQRAADEMRKAADAAEREMQNARDASAMQDAQKSLQQSQSEMAGASSPADVGQPGSSQSGQQGQSGQSDSSDSGQSDSSGSDQNSGNGQGDTSKAEQEMRRQGGEGNGDKSGNGDGDQPGQEGNGGGGSANRAGNGSSGSGAKHHGGKFEKFQGPPGRLNPNFDPSKFPKYAKIYLGKPGNGKAAGRISSSRKLRPGVGGHPNVDSSVPYYNYIGPAKKAAENAVDNENIPPAYKKSVQQYFNALTPPAQ